MKLVAAARLRRAQDAHRRGAPLRRSAARRLLAAVAARARRASAGIRCSTRASEQRRHRGRRHLRSRPLPAASTPTCIRRDGASRRRAHPEWHGGAASCRSARRRVDFWRRRKHPDHRQDVPGPSSTTLTLRAGAARSPTVAGRTSSCEERSTRSTSSTTSSSSIVSQLVRIEPAPAARTSRPTEPTAKADGRERALRLSLRAVAGGRCSRAAAALHRVQRLPRAARVDRRRASARAHDRDGHRDQERQRDDRQR